MNVTQYPHPYTNLNEYHECIIYGYDYSSEMLKSLNPMTINEFEMFTAFDCKEQSLQYEFDGPKTNGRNLKIGQR